MMPGSAYSMLMSRSFSQAPNQPVAPYNNT
jgi:hypothetical protein